MNQRPFSQDKVARSRAIQTGSFFLASLQQEHPDEHLESPRVLLMISFATISKRRVLELAERKAYHILPLWASMRLFRSFSW
jgi:hypothetical protein